MTLGLPKALHSQGGCLTAVQGAACSWVKRQVPTLVLRPEESSWEVRASIPAATHSSVISLRGREQASSRVLVFCKMGLEIEILVMCETYHLFGNLAGRFTGWKLSVKGSAWENEKVFWGVCWGGTWQSLARTHSVTVPRVERPGGTAMVQTAAGIFCMLIWTQGSIFRCVGQWLEASWLPWGRHPFSWSLHKGHLTWTTSEGKTLFSEGRRTFLGEWRGWGEGRKKKKKANKNHQDFLQCLSLSLQNHESLLKILTVYIYRSLGIRN